MKKGQAENQGFQFIEIKKLTESKSNYRKTFNKAGMEELTASVKAKGVLQPVLVRPVKGNGRFEVVAGHRRLRAAIAAGLKEMPCMGTIAKTA